MPGKRVVCINNFPRTAGHREANAKLEAPSRYVKTLGHSVCTIDAATTLRTNRAVCESVNDRTSGGHGFSIGSNIGVMMYLAAKPGWVIYRKTASELAT